MNAVIKMFLSIVVPFLLTINFSLPGFPVPDALITNLSNASISDINRAPDLVPSDWHYAWHTFYEPTGFNEHPRSFTVDWSGGTYIIASSQATWNGPDGQLPLHPYSGARDITVIKLDAGGAYQWHTFYGSLGTDLGEGIVADGSGGIYILASSMYSWNGPLGQLPLNPHTEGENFDLTVLKLDESGAYQWHTFYGGGTIGGYMGYDIGTGIALSNTGEIYVTGTSETSWDGPAGQVPLHAFSAVVDITVLKLSATGAYQWHTFYGSPTDDDSRGIAIDDLGGVYIHGSVGGSSIYVLKLDATGEYQWHNFYGSGSYSSGIAIDNAGGVYINGDSNNSWLGPEGQAPLHPFSGDPYTGDITILKINTSGAYQWHTFYGSPTADTGGGVAVDGKGGVYLNGASYDTWNGPVGQLPLHAYSGESDFAVLKLNALGAYQWHTFYGSPATEGASELAMDAIGALYNLGISDSSWLGPAGQAPLHEFTGAYDITVLKLVYQTNRTYLPLTIR